MLVNSRIPEFPSLSWTYRLMGFEIAAWQIIKCQCAAVESDARRSANLDDNFVRERRLHILCKVLSLLQYRYMRH